MEHTNEPRRGTARLLAAMVFFLIGLLLLPAWIDRLSGRIYRLTSRPGRYPEDTEPRIVRAVPEGNKGGHTDGIL